MRRFGKFAAVICLCAIFLAGCAETKVPNVVDSPTISVGKDGTITVWQTGEFGKTYYDLSELTAMAEQEAALYNAEKGKEAAVAVEKVEALDGGQVMVVYRFDGWESCTEFGEDTLFFGTFKEAELNSFDTEVSMKSVKGETGFNLRQVGPEGDKNLLITNIKADIYCYDSIAYISEDAVVNADGSIRPSEESEFVYILLK